MYKNYNYLFYFLIYFILITYIYICKLRDVIIYINNIIIRISKISCIKNLKEK